MKKRILSLVLVVASFVLTTSCKKEAAHTQQTFDAAAAKTEVEARSKIFVEALNSKDSVGLANCYTNDAKFMQPNDKTVEGRANIQKLFGSWMKGPMMQITINTIEVWGDENMLAAENTWTFMDQNGKTVDTGKSLEIYKKEDGVWKLHRDCYNSDMPAMPAGK
ncbi:nuclear transport factor 2 family protein [Flavobacterium sp.]|uniref:YybH family protein n=1 Tax=Flavobacterium sp. TaxID=239 RepID=UPI0026355CA1|nr:nuclear transport factor 2 family protein [Flavobacterium sp.]